MFQSAPSRLTQGLLLCGLWTLPSAVGAQAPSTAPPEATPPTIQLPVVALQPVLQPGLNPQRPAGPPGKPPTLSLPQVVAPAPAVVEAGPQRPDGVPLRVTSEPKPTNVYVGLTRLGTTPLNTALPEGEYPLAAWRAGSIVTRRPIDLEEGHPGRWRTTVRKPWPEPAWDWPDGSPSWLARGCARKSGCGLGEARHFSPPLRDAIARARALVEVARGRNITISRLEKVYVESWGQDLVFVNRQRTRARVRPGTLNRLEDDEPRVIYRVLAGKGGGHKGVASLGAGDALQVKIGPEGQGRLARIAALAGAARWLLASAEGARVQAELKTFVQGDRDRILYDDVARVRVKGRLGQGGSTVAIESTIRDHQEILQKRNIPVSLEAASDDVITLKVRHKGKQLEIKVIDGVTRSLTNGQGEPVKPRAALEMLRKALTSGGVYIWSLEAGTAANKVPTARAVLGLSPGGRRVALR